MICSSISMACRGFLVALLTASTLWLGSGFAAAEPVSASIMMYHRFGDDRFPSTSVTMAQLAEHIAELKTGGYNVVHLSTIIEAMERGEALPPRTVAITVDDAYATVFENGWPKFREAGLPVTLFVSTGPVDQGLDDMMTWEQIRTMQSEGAAIGAHSVSHLHMTQSDMERNRREIAESNSRFEAEIGKVPEFFAYPYGEASSEIVEMIRNSGYRAAFGQHSGVASSSDNRFYLPRFALNEKYGDIGRFKTAANALALPVSDLTPVDMLIDARRGDANPPAVGFTVTDDIGDLDRLTCFFSHEGAAMVERLGDTRIEVRAEEPMPNGRSRLNCTLPARGDNAGRWHWYGRQFMVQ